MAKDLDSYSVEQVAHAIASLGQDHWRDKIREFVHGLNQKPLLTALGKAVNHLQLLEILESAEVMQVEQRWKLMPILIGVHHRVFEEAVLMASPQQLQILKDEGITEPVQHQLTVSLHEWAKDIEAHAAVMHQLLREISTFIPSDNSAETLRNIQTKLITVSKYYYRMEQKINTGLSLAWNTNRSDLIDKMTALKDSCMKYNSFVIGHPHTPDRMATGLYALLEKQLDVVYGKEGDEESVDDDDPAIEGLTRLGVWYLQDYWEAGLLPGVQKLRMEDEEAEEGKLRERLYFLASENLARIGLSTVRDLKMADIYSKEMLFHYVTEHRSKLKS